MAVASQQIGYVAQLGRQVTVIESAHAPLYERADGFPTSQPGNLSEGGSGRVALGSPPRRVQPLRHQDFERLYAAHARPLLAFLVYRTGDQALAEDLLGDTFERVLRTTRRFDVRRGSEKTWLYAIALNALRDHARRRSAEQRALERTPRLGLEDAAAPHEIVHDRDVVRRSLEVLSSDERLVVSLRFGADLTMPEIAKLVGEPLTTVEARVYRALRKLRTELA